VGFATPEEAALAGDRVTPDTFVVARASTEDAAVVILMAPGWAQPDRVDLQRGEDGWTEITSGSGGTIWSGSSDEPALGTLGSWGGAPPGAKSARVTFHGVTTEIPVTNGHWAWIVNDVREDEWDDPAEFAWQF